MDKHLSEEKFDKWKEEDFAPIKLTCNNLDMRLNYVTEKVDDVDLKIDAVLGDLSTKDAKASRTEGALWVMIPIVVLVLSLVVHMWRNGVS